MRKSEKKKTPIRFHEGLQQLRKDAGGMDIGSTEIWVDVGVGNDSEPVRRFETFTADLNRMAEWLMGCGIKTVVMESTGVYWIPACQILEDKGIEVLLVNPRYAKNVSGRKTDVLDCQWLRTLHCYGLLPASFRPAQEIASLRSYLRHRQMLIEYAAAHIQHMQKAMTQMNLQLHHVISDITGLTGMRIIRAIVAGERNGQKLAGMRHERTHADQATIEKALEGDYRTEHLFALKQSLAAFDHYQKQIAECDQQIAEHVRSLETKAESSDGLKAARRPRRKQRNQMEFNVREEAFRISGVDLTQINGISESAALSLISEIGINMSPWKTEKHFAAWLSLCPNNKISGGRVLKSRTRKTANRARNILRLCAQSLLFSKSALGAFCRRICSRLGKPKGIIATAHKLALLIYRMLKCGSDFVDIGQEKYENQFKERALKSLARRAKDLGLQLVPSPENVVP
jgi:transposase